MARSPGMVTVPERLLFDPPAAGLGAARRWRDGPDRAIPRRGDATGDGRIHHFVPRPPRPFAAFPPAVPAVDTVADVVAGLSLHPVPRGGLTSLKSLAMRPPA